MGYLPHYDEDTPHPLEEDLLDLGRGLIQKVERSLGEDIEGRDHPANDVYSTLKSTVNKEHWSVEDRRTYSWFVPWNAKKYEPFRAILNDDEFSGLLNIMSRLNTSAANHIREKFEMKVEKGK